MRNYFRLIFLILCLCNINLFASDDKVLQEIVNMRRTFFNSDVDWEEFVQNGDTKIGSSNVYIAVKHILPRRIKKDDFAKIITKMKSNDYSKTILEQYYKESNGRFVLSPLTDKNHITQIAKIFKKFNFAEYDYAVSFYAESDYSKTGSFGTFNYLFDATGNLYECRVNIHQEDSSYILFDVDRPKHCDVYLFGNLYVKDLLYYFPFDSLKFTEIGTILDILQENKLYDELVIQTDDYKIKNNFIERVVIPALNNNYTNDGARNSIGDFVYIATGKEQTGKEKGFNCSGFLKEVCDNYIRIGEPDFKFMDIADLKTRRLDERKNPTYARYEESYDPFFGLDWIRNTCDQINAHYKFKSSKACELNGDSKAQYFTDFGYNFSDLENILFRDQQIDPNNFYLLAFNKYRDTRPTIPIFYHVAVVVPVYENGTFNLRLFESGFERDSFYEKARVLMPKQIHWRRFEEDIKEKLEEASEVDAIKSVYTYNKKTGYHTLNENSSLPAILKARKVLDTLEFDKQKVAVYKVPLKSLYFMK